MLRAINAIPEDSDTVVSVPEDLKDYKLPDNVKKVVSQGSSYPELVNAGIKEVGDADYISILEYDDYLQENAHKIIDMYMNDESADILAPMAYVVEEGEGKPILRDFANKTPFNTGAVDEYGLYDMDLLLKANYLFVNSCYIKPHVFEEYGLFKDSFKYFYDYEWMLRAAYNGATIKGIPKATHVHYTSPGGAGEQHRLLPREEASKWIDKARCEYFFEEDRTNEK